MRVRPNGRSIRSSFEANRIKNFILNNGKHYNCVLGSGAVDELSSDVSNNWENCLLQKVPSHFVPGSSDIKRQLITIFHDALDWNIQDINQLTAIMKAKGLTCYRRKRGNGSYATLMKVVKNGRSGSRPYSLEKDFGYPAETLLKERLADKSKSKTVNPDAYVRTKVICETAFAHAQSLEGFEALCNSCGISVSFFKNKRTHAFAFVALVTPRYRTVLYTDAINVPAKAFAEKVSFGVWSEDFVPGESTEFSDEEIMNIRREISRQRKFLREALEPQDVSLEMSLRL